MPKSKSKSNKDSSQPETPSAPEQQLLSIKPKRPQQDVLADAEKTSPPPVEQKLLSIKPKKTEEVLPPSETQSQSTSVPEATQTNLKRPESALEKELTPLSQAPSESASVQKEVTENQEDRPQKPAFQKPQLKKPQPPPYKNLEEVTISSGETFIVGEQVKVTTANYGEYVVAIKFIYEAADGSVWASYSHTNKEQRHPWRWGCCRADLLKKELNE